MAQSMTRPGFHPSPWWVCVCVRACVGVCVTSLHCFSAWGLIRPACPRLHDVGKWSWQCLWSPMTQTHTYTFTHSLTPFLTQCLSYTHTHVRKGSLDHRSWNAYELLWWVARTPSITLHILSEDSWGICAYSHNRHRSPDTHTCPGLKAATQTVPCDVFCIILQSEIKPGGSADTNTNRFILCSIVLCRWAEKCVL